MSFSSEVRAELANKYTKSRSCQKAEMCACLLIGSKFDFTQAGKKFNITKEDIEGIPAGELTKNTPEKRAFLRGAFISAGSISDPEKGYHLEIICETLQKAVFVRELIESFGIQSHIASRNAKSVVYIKDGDGIADFLRCTEASSSLMKYENIRIVREMRGSVNRQVNCETANIGKTVAAAGRQIRDIELIDHTIGIDSLDEPLKDICIARLENPDISLEELGRTLTPPLGKSGVNHRLRKVADIADTIRRDEYDQEKY